MYRFILFFTFAVVSVTSQYSCEYPSIYDFSSQDDYPDSEEPAFSPGKPPPRKNESPIATPKPQTSRIPVTTSTAPPPPTSPKPSTTVSRPTPPRINSEPFPSLTIGTPLTTNGPSQSTIEYVRTEISVTTSTVPPRMTPPRINTAGSIDVPDTAELITRVGEDISSVQQTQKNELYCLEVLDSLIATQWQEDIDRLSVKDLGNFSTMIKVPEFQSYYSNPESEWIQVEGMALNKLDKCVRNLVGSTAPRMNQEEIDCLNKIYPDYLLKESKVAKLMEMNINESYREQLPFKSFYTYFEMTEVLFDNKNIDALDAELRAVHEDMLEFYIKTEEDKTKKIFIVEQECEWKNARVLREVGSENERYQKFGQLVKSLVNRYLVAEILQKWVPGVVIISEDRYNLWSTARSTMEKEIAEKVNDLQQQKRDAQFLCTYAAQFATKFFEGQKAILFDKTSNASLSLGLKTFAKYSYVVALEGLLAGKNDNRLSRVQVLVKEFKEGHYCLTNFVRMIENHQRYKIASTFVNEELPYGITYCQVKEMSAELVNPRYCKCQGTFCEEFGLATLRAQRFQLNLLPNGTYAVTTNSSYRILPLDELINSANQRIAGQKFNTWWYRHQKNPPVLNF